MSLSSSICIICLYPQTHLSCSNYFRLTQSALLPKRIQDSMDQLDGIIQITFLTSELLTELSLDYVAFYLFTSPCIPFKFHSDYYKMLIGGDPNKDDPKVLEDLIEVSLLLSLNLLCVKESLTYLYLYVIVCSWMDTAVHCQWPRHSQ